MSLQADGANETVHTTVVQDRRFYMECVVVRVMKMRKTLSTVSLVQEVVRLCRPRFTPDPQLVRTIIDNLIEKQYLQRTELDDTITYLA
jgi:hypothetical protein